MSDEYRTGTESDRTHEECCDCDFQYVIPSVCSGHVEGPIRCLERPELEKNRDLYLQRVNSEDNGSSVSIDDKGKFSIKFW